MTAPNDPGMDTPLSPLADGDGNAAPAPTPRRGRRVTHTRVRSTRAHVDAAPAAGGRTPLRAGLAYLAGSWRVLLFLVLVQLLLGLTVVLPFWQAISARLDYHPHAASLAGSPTAYDKGFAQWRDGGMDPGIWRDMLRLDATFHESLATTTWWIALVAWLFGAVAAGGFLGTAVGGEDPVRVGSFLTHGARLYGPMLRMGLCFALAFYLVARLVMEAWGGSVQSSEFMDPSEAAGFWGARLREAVVVLAFFWLRIAADLGRARMALLGTRGAVRAFLGGLVRALRPKAILLALAFGLPTTLLLFGLGFLAQALTGDATWVLILLFVVFQLAVLLRWAARGALLASYAKLG